jgi:hypothetical protein
MEIYTSIFIVSAALWTVLIGYLIYTDAKIRRL